MHMLFWPSLSHSDTHGPMEVVYGDQPIRLSWCHLPQQMPFQIHTLAVSATWECTSVTGSPLYAVKSSLKLFKQQLMPHLSLILRTDIQQSVCSLLTLVCSYCSSYQHIIDLHHFNTHFSFYKWIMMETSFITNNWIMLFLDFNITQETAQRQK